MKTFFKGLGITLFIYVAYLMLLILSVLVLPLAAILVPIGAFAYASNPESIIKEYNEDDD